MIFLLLFASFVPREITPSDPIFLRVRMQDEFMKCALIQVFLQEDEITALDSLLHIFVMFFWINNAIW